MKHLLIATAWALALLMIGVHGYLYAVGDDPTPVAHLSLSLCWVIILVQSVTSVFPRPRSEQ